MKRRHQAMLVVGLTVVALTMRLQEARPAATKPSLPADNPSWSSLSANPQGGVASTLADPGAIHAGGGFHVYGTTKAPHRVPHFTSRSLDSPAMLRGDAMPQLPAWVDPGDSDIWAPTVSELEGRYVMHFAASSGDPAHDGSKCLGAAVAATPEGPFVPETASFHCVPGWWSIDPYVVSDGHDRYLLWRQDTAEHPTGRLVAARLRPDGLGVADPTVHTLLAGEYAWEDGYPDHPDHPGSLGIGPIENPAMARHPATGQWLLTWSANRWENPEYATGLATCQHPLGPCERVSREVPWVRTSADPTITTTASFAGFGGLSFAHGPDGELYAVGHGYRQPRPEGEERIAWAYRVAHDPASGYRLTEF